jgi:hypothetical protein
MNDSAVAEKNWAPARFEGKEKKIHCSTDVVQNGG